MGIDIGFYDPDQEESEEFERICNVSGFFAIAEVLSNLLDMIEVNQIPFDLEIAELEPCFEAFQRFVTSPDSEVYDERFHHYCRFICAAHEQLEAEHGLLRDELTGQHLIKPEADEFRPDVRIFLGRGILNDEPITPADAEQLLPPMTYATMLIARFVNHFRDDEPEIADHFEGILGMLSTVPEYCERAVQESRSLIISY
jgi:hypothetical protein